MTLADNRALTERQYWESVWSGLRADGRYSNLQWIRRNYVYSALDGLLRSVLPADRTKTFIELGSGPGRWLIYFHKTYGYQVFGCDYSAVSCELARKNLDEARVPGTIIEASFFDLSDQYDVVYSGGVIEHFEDSKTVLETFCRLVRPGGMLITDIPNLTGLNGLYRRLLKPETFNTHRVIRLAELRQWHRDLSLRELLGTCYGSLCMSRVPPDAFTRVPWLQRAVWTPFHTIVSAGINRGCLAFRHLARRFDHPLISPHLLIVAQRSERSRS